MGRVDIAGRLNSIAIELERWSKRKFANSSFQIHSIKMALQNLTNTVSCKHVEERVKELERSENLWR